MIDPGQILLILGIILALLVIGLIYLVIYIVQAIGISRLCKKLEISRSRAAWMPGWQPMALLRAGDEAARKENEDKRRIEGQGNAILFGLPIVITVLYLGVLALTAVTDPIPIDLHFIIQALLLITSIASVWFVALFGLSYFEVISIPFALLMVLGKGIPLLFELNPFILLAILAYLLMWLGYVFLFVLQCISCFRVFKPFMPVWLCWVLIVVKILLPGISFVMPLIVSFFPRKKTAAEQDDFFLV
jgi:hypothetical protein